MNRQTKIGLMTAGGLLVGCLALTVCATVGLVGVVYWSATQPDFDPMVDPLDAGRTAPDFTLAALQGEPRRLRDQRGQPVVLNFYTTWCPDCRAEAAQMQRWHEAYPDLTFWAIDLEEDAPTARQFAREFEWTLDVLLDTEGEVAAAYRVYAIPTWYFIDADGVIQATYIEALTDAHWVEGLEKIGVALK